jgi:hypothetical protein
MAQFVRQHIVVSLRRQLVSNKDDVSGRPDVEQTVKLTISYRDDWRPSFPTKDAKVAEGFAQGEREHPFDWNFQAVGDKAFDISGQHMNFSFRSFGQKVVKHGDHRINALHLRAVAHCIPFRQFIQQSQQGAQPGARRETSSL